MKSNFDLCLLKIIN